MSAEAFQARLIWLQLAVDAVSPVGIDGAVGSATCSIVVVVVETVVVVVTVPPGDVTVSANVPAAPPYPSTTM